jgi:bifunctional DNA-binding transcriptional regulator/antitoxin component of YhaV-PrlF toxin-antitoxin module
MALEIARKLPAEARLRARNQLTLPDPIVQAAGLDEGDRFVVDIDPVEPDVVRLRRVRDSYAGALASVYGDAQAALAAERGSWPDTQ